MIIGLVLTLVTNPVFKASAAKPCHCRNGTDWDTASRTCRSGCEDDWTGDSCEIGSNIALNGVAFQSSTYGDASLYTNGQSMYSADKAVDGQVSTEFTSRNCATTHRSSNPWWYVAFNNSVEYNILSVTIQYVFDTGKRLPCNCLQNATCLENGYCPNGCASNKTGPACLIEPLPRVYTMSSTVSYYRGERLFSGNAADNHIGITNGQSDLLHCAQTAEYDRQPWWMVVLGGQELYVVTSVTIYNQYDSSLRDKLRNFSIVYSQSVTTDIADWTAKEICYYHENALLDHMANFVCIRKAIARSVGIELVSRAGDSEAYLTLCEVFVYGYKYEDCPQGYTGPGCLLHSCESNVCRSNGGSCDSSGACIFLDCPDKSYVPPQCWMRNFTSTQLVNFDILAGNAGSGPPDPRTWRTCQSSASMYSTRSTLYCNNIRGQRLAIYLKGENERMLTLCEVTVAGFPTTETTSLCGKPTGVAALECHCAGNERCTFANDFKCPGTCKVGWAGDDCRSSLLTTFSSKSMQLNTLCDENLAKRQMCLYGPEKALDNNVTTCTSTSASDYPWWFVQLDDSDMFGIEHVRLVTNSIKHDSPAKQNFLILASNGTSGFPDPETWHAVPYILQSVGTDGLSLGHVPMARRLAVYLNMRNASLSICEVFIRGHKLFDEADLSLSNVLLLRRVNERTVHVAINLSKRLWYNNPTTVSLAWQLTDTPVGKVYITYEGPRWYTFNFQLQDDTPRLMTFWWETQYCSTNGSAQCHNGTRSATMVAQSDEY